MSSNLENEGWWHRRYVWNSAVLLFLLTYTYVPNMVCPRPSVQKLFKTISNFHSFIFKMMAKVKNIRLMFGRLTCVVYVHMYAKNCSDRWNRFHNIWTRTFPVFTLARLTSKMKIKDMGDRSEIRRSAVSYWPHVCKKMALLRIAKVSWNYFSCT